MTEQQAIKQIEVFRAKEAEVFKRASEATGLPEDKLRQAVDLIDFIRRQG